MSIYNIAFSPNPTQPKKDRAPVDSSSPVYLTKSSSKASDSALSTLRKCFKPEQLSEICVYIEKQETLLDKLTTEIDTTIDELNTCPNKNDTDLKKELELCQKIDSLTERRNNLYNNIICNKKLTEQDNSALIKKNNENKKKLLAKFSPKSQEIHRLVRASAFQPYRPSSTLDKIKGFFSDLLNSVLDCFRMDKLVKLSNLERKINNSLTPPPTRTIFYRKPRDTSNQPQGLHAIHGDPYPYLTYPPHHGCAIKPDKNASENSQTLTTKTPSKDDFSSVSPFSSGPTSSSDMPEEDEGPMRPDGNPV